MFGNEVNIANIVASLPLDSSMAGLDKIETLMFYELFKHIIERMSGSSNWGNKSVCNLLKLTHPTVSTTTKATIM